ncbi:LOW QUALITY PROTEIN: hypothetical protein CVT26_015456 [Gymnopilus dilepis]|uniref:Uncharacterized protein n=1 Tax=Gymnopilus dilepis TaxID=231916 RepID=A0A409W4B3_9AGAR|nr:LOW QUALITY PROTEIN: hypothetical protein CVT26_015456 [Gymnopilus dilepis]
MIWTGGLQMTYPLLSEGSASTNCATARDTLSMCLTRHSLQNWSLSHVAIALQTSLENLVPRRTWKKPFLSFLQPLNFVHVKDLPEIVLIHRGCSRTLKMKFLCIKRPLNIDHFNHLVLLNDLGFASWPI